MRISTRSHHLLHAHCRGVHRKRDRSDRRARHDAPGVARHWRGCWRRLAGRAIGGQGAPAPRRAHVSGAAGADRAHDARCPAVRAMEVGPVLRPREKDRHAQARMRILYTALDQIVPGTLGGSVHVAAVAEGLAALGHEVHVATQVGSTSRARPLRPCSGSRSGLRWDSPCCGGCAPAGSRRLRAQLRADVVIERYYNFGGEGVIAAHRLGLPAVLEVNAPIVDYPGSAKARLDRALLVEPMRRWRDRLCRQTGLFVTPSAAILPAMGRPVARARNRVGRRHGSVSTGRRRAGAVPARLGPNHVCLCRRLSHRGTAPAQLASALARRHHAGRRSVRPASSLATARNARRPSGPQRGVPRVHVHRRAPARRAACAHWPPPTLASRRSNPADTRRCDSGSTGRR